MKAKLHAGSEPDAELFRLMAAAVKDYAIVLLDSEGKVASWNAGAQAIAGYEEQEIIGKHFSTFHRPEELARSWPTYELQQALEQGRFEEEGWRVRQDGAQFWACTTLSALKDPDGELLAYSLGMQDLTQRKHTEAIENVTRSINEFIAVLAHELRNPLAPIRSAVDILKGDAAMSADSSQVVQILDRQSGQLTRIVDDIIDVSRITRGTFSVHKKPTNVLDILTRAVEAARPAMDAMGHSFTMETSNAPLMIAGDEVRLTQAITNLLNNATRYTEPGGSIRLAATTEKHEGNTELVISVRDNGRGIAPHVIDTIFGMFVQGEDKRNITGTGLGVGLALTKTIVELHEGRLEARSEGLGRGSEFVLHIPLVQEHTAPPKVRSSSAEQQRICILVVDDNVDAALMLGASLKKLGHHVLTSYSAREALEVYDRYRPDLVLLDIGMPVMNGYDLARQIRQHPCGTSSFLVAVTGWGKDEDRYRSKEAGIDLHLVKPVEQDVLLAVLNTPTLSEKSSTCHCPD